MLSYVFSPEYFVTCLPEKILRRVLKIAAQEGMNDCRKYKWINIDPGSGANYERGLWKDGE